MRALDRLVRGVLAGAVLAVATPGQASVALTATYVLDAAPKIHLELRTDAPFTDVAVLDVFLHAFSDDLLLEGVMPFFVPDSSFGDARFPGYGFDGPAYPTLQGPLLRWTFGAPPADAGAFDFAVSGLVTLGDESTVAFGPVRTAVAVPEPSTSALLLAGLAALVAVTRRRFPSRRAPA